MLPDGRAGGNYASRPRTELVEVLRAEGFHNQRGFLPNLEGDRGTPRSQINQTQRNLRRAVDQRFAVVGHPQGVDVRVECVRCTSGAGEVAVSDHLQAANAGVHEPTEVEAGDDAIAVSRVHNLRTSEAQLEVCGHDFLNGGGVAEQVGGLGTRLAHKAVKRLSGERAGSQLAGNIVGVRAVGRSNPILNAVEFQRAGSRVANREQAIFAV